MLSNAQVQQALAKIQHYFDEVNSLYINKIASQIRKIGELSQSSINRMVILDEITADAAYVTSQLRRATGLSKVDISNILTAAAADVYTDPRFNNAYILRRAGAAKSAMAQRRLNHYLEIMLEQTSMMMDNFSNTTIISSSYRHAADVAITAVSSGLESYTEATRRVIRQIGYNGLQVQYASGYHRRLDTAIRQNVLDAVHQIAQHGADIYGQELGFNAVELSAHLHPAKDHEQVQGHVFLKTEFAKMQAGMDCVDVDGRSYTGFRRKIGEWNCMHMAVPFDTRYSVRRYTDEQLQSWLDQNKRGCVIDGKAYTIYEASQLMRKVETQVRRLKDAANAAKAAGDDQLRRQLQGQINDMMVKYQQIAAISGLAEQRQRTSVEGFRSVNVSASSSSPMASKHVTAWPSGGLAITDDKLNEIESYAQQCGVNFMKNTFKGFEGDPKELTDIIDKMKEIADRFPKVRSGKRGLQLFGSFRMDDQDYAESHPGNITINCNAFRNAEALKEDYAKMMESGFFVHGTSYKDIIYHEMGHYHLWIDQPPEHECSVNLSLAIKHPVHP